MNRLNAGSWAGGVGYGKAICGIFHSYDRDKMQVAAAISEAYGRICTTGI